MNENHNADAIAGLREIADWLERNPDLPQVWYGMVRLRDPYDGSARETLTRVATALGDRATEEFKPCTDVQIVGRFAVGTEVRIGTNAKHLGAVSVEPVYQPILPVKATS